MLSLLFETSSSEGFGAAFAVDGAGDDAPGVACTFTAGIEALDGDVVQHFLIARDAQW